MTLVSFSEIKIGALYLVTPVLGTSNKIIIFVTSKSTYNPDNMFAVPLICGISANKQMKLDYFNCYFDELV